MIDKTSIIYEINYPKEKDFFKLFESTGWNEEYHLNTDELYSSLSKSYYTVSAYDREKLIGFGRIVSDGILHAMIYEMIVYPEYQRKGIGAKILEMLVQKCLSDNIRDIQLFCAKGKRAFYEKHGFTARPDDAPGMEYNFKNSNGEIK